LTELLSSLRRDAGVMANVASWRTLPAQDAQFADTPPFVHPLLRAGLARRGIARLYTHQVAALEHAHAGRNTVIVTPTASGKTLAYHLPVLNALLAEPAGRALYLYPTKALTQDQLATLRGWSDEIVAGGGLPIPVGLYDGDTPAGERPRIRTSTRLLLTNPDMLHVGILPMHVQWAEFFGGLRFVVIDELHTYRGVFGSHVANVLRRLMRVCAHYGARPQVVCTSATIANPQELAEALVEAPFAVVDANGAPRGEKHVILYNPPLVDAEHGVRRSAVLEAQETAARCVAFGVQTIVFARSRLTAELLLSYLRDTLRDFNARAPVESRIDVEQAIRGYRGGYLAHERRAIEAGLREGAVRAVTATNALELGIDIGRLQAAVLCGYPGSIAGLWQQMGRAGRTVEGAVAILVTSGLPIDQYLVQHPKYIFERSPERALV
ncbi:MAG: DEAD/DEAH box helicase, partial [Caldilineaceae bacterium]